MNVDFTYVPAVPEEVSSVHLAGSFNDWNNQNTPMTYDKKVRHGSTPSIFRKASTHINSF